MFKINSSMCWGERGEANTFEKLDLVIRNSGPACACRFPPAQFCRLLGQKGFVGSSKYLYQSYLLQDIIQVLIFGARGGNVLWANKQAVVLQPPPCFHMSSEWVSVSLAQQPARAGQEETSAGGPGSLPALSQLSIAARQLLRDEQLKR